MKQYYENYLKTKLNRIFDVFNKIFTNNDTKLTISNIQTSNLVSNSSTLNYATITNLTAPNFDIDITRVLKNGTGVFSLDSKGKLKFNQDIDYNNTVQFKNGINLQIKGISIKNLSGSNGVIRYTNEQGTIMFNVSQFGKITSNTIECTSAEFNVVNLSKNSYIPVEVSYNGITINTYDKDDNRHDFICIDNKAFSVFKPLVEIVNADVILADLNSFKLKSNNISLLIDTDNNLKLKNGVSDKVVFDAMHTNEYGQMSDATYLHVDNSIVQLSSLDHKSNVKLDSGDTSIFGENHVILKTKDCNNRDKYLKVICDESKLFLTSDFNFNIGYTDELGNINFDKSNGNNNINVAAYKYENTSWITKFKYVPGGLSTSKTITLNYLIGKLIEKGILSASDNWDVEPEFGGND